MKFFATTESYKTISKKLIDVQNIISEKLQSFLKDKNYGEGIIDWGYISIVNPTEFYEAGFFKEIKKYSKKDKDLDLRLKIDYQEMLKADENTIYKLISKSILKGIDIAEHELKIKDFNFNFFRNDLTNLFKSEGWI